MEEYRSPELERLIAANLALAKSEECTPTVRLLAQLAISQAVAADRLKAILDKLDDLVVEVKP